MHGQNIAGAIAALSGQLESALVNGHDTRSIRAEMAAIEQRERTAAAKAEAKERALRAAADAEEEERQRAAAETLAAEVRARIEAKLAALALPAPLAVRRFPDGSVILTENED